MLKTAVITCTYSTTEFQDTLLIKNVLSVQKYHPDAQMVILNDNYEKNIHNVLKRNSDIKFDSLIIEHTEHRAAGECNAYVWSCKHVNEYDRFIFIHDSVILHGKIPIDLKHVHFRPLWYATPFHASTGLINLDVETAIVELIVDNDVGTKLYDIIIRHDAYVIFGCMGVWDKEFVNFIRTRTNFLAVVYKINTRRLRCMMERIIHIFFKYCHPSEKMKTFPSLAICGEIFKHKDNFSNTSFDPKLANNPYALKIWQGR
jgi:hypothetical protein